MSHAYLNSIFSLKTGKHICIQYFTDKEPENIGATHHHTHSALSVISVFSLNVCSGVGA